MAMGAAGPPGPKSRTAFDGQSSHGGPQTRRGGSGLEFHSNWGPEAGCFYNGSDRTDEA